MNNMWTKHRRKIVVGLPICVLLLSVLTACTNKKTERSDSGGKTVLRYAGAAYKLYDAYRVQQGSGFAKLHPNVIVKYETIPDSTYDSKLTTQIAGGTEPDVFLIFGGPFIDYASKGALLDLTPYVEGEKDSNISQIIPTLTADYKYNGRIYALPGNGVVDVLFYNKKLFDESSIPYPGYNWTWKEYLEAAKRLTKKDASGRISQFGIITPGPWSNFIFQNGGKFWNKDRTKCIINSTEAMEALEFLKDLRGKYHVMPTISEEKQQGASEMFMGGRGAMLSGGGWNAALFLKQKNLEWGIAPLPKGRFRATRFGAMGWAVSAHSRNPRLAYELVKYMIRPEGIRFLVDIGDSIPIHKSEMKSDYFINDSRRPKGENLVYLEAMNYGYGLNDLVHPKISYNKMSSLMELEIEKFYLGKQTAKEALDNIARQLNQMIQS